MGLSLVMGRKSGSRPRDGVGQPGRLTKNPGNRKIPERNWGPERVVRRRPSAMLRRVRIPGRL